jgi:hypothetical protein
MKLTAKKFKDELGNKYNIYLDYRRDVFCENFNGAVPVISYSRTVEIVTAAYDLAEKNGYNAVYNIDIEIDKLRTSEIKFLMMKLSDGTK